VSELYIYQNARCKNKKNAGVIRNPFLSGRPRLKVPDVVRWVMYLVI